MIQKVKSSEDLYKRSLHLLRQILSHHIPENTQVCIFGSSAKNQRKEDSDIDIGFLTSVPFQVISKIRAEIEEAPIPYKVDLVDFSKVKNQSFKEHALKNGVLWKDLNKN